MVVFKSHIFDNNRATGLQLNCSLCSNQTYLHRLQFRRVENGRGSKDVRLRSAHFVSGDGGSEALKGRRRMEMGVVGRHIGGSGVAG